MLTYLNVPYADKDAAKRLGARWDAARKRWYVKDVENIAKFMRWMPEHLARPTSSKPKNNTPLAREKHKQPSRVELKLKTGDRYYETECKCCQPWEVCEHSFPEVLEDEYTAMQEVADAMNR